jgi:CopG family transcriptional regulator, nickel-responsive regulator
MGKVVRFALSIEKELFQKFERYIKENKFPNRSYAIRNIMRDFLVKIEWKSNKPVAGVITLVYNHKKRELVVNLMSIQHKFHHIISSTGHIHLDEYNCLEIIIVRGKSNLIKKLYLALKSTKGVKHTSITVSTTKEKLP